MKLYGDGIHDDTAALQEIIDAAKTQLIIPVPEQFYLISKTLILHSDLELIFSAYTQVVLAPNSDCMMLRCDDAVNVTVCGGIWDMRNKTQKPNPLICRTFGEITHDDYDERYLGVMMRFFHIKNLNLSGMTLREPVTFAIQMAEIYQFTVSDITFDFTDGNPIMGTMDGVHIEGGCRFGRLTNLKGRCFDDLVAINADDFHRGDITDISVDGIYAEGSHSAARLLSNGSKVKNISINNVFGTFYQYCIGLTRYYDDYKRCGDFENISLSNIYGCKSVRYPTFYDETSYVYPYIFVETGVKIRNLTVRELHRDEVNVDVETMFVGSGSVVENVSFRDCTYTNTVGNAPFLSICGTVGTIIRDNVVIGEGLEFSVGGTKL